MDAPWVILKRNHRRYFHDLGSAVAIAQRLYPNDDNAVSAAIYHIQLDDLCSNDLVLKLQLEFLSGRESPKRKSKKKRSKVQPMPPEFRRLLEDLKKMAEIERLWKLAQS